MDFGPSPYYPGGSTRIKLNCYFYRTLLVKEFDEGQKGAERMAIVPSRTGAPAACDRLHAKGERLSDPGEWSGYFKGVKGQLVFFNAADGTDGGIPFLIYDSTTGKRIFEDLAYDSTLWSEKPADSPFNQLRVTSGQDGQISLTYLRVVDAACDLHLEKASCGEQVRKKLKLKNTQMPVCTGYKGIPTRSISSVAYPVYVLLFPQATTQTIVGPVKCWPVD